MSTQKPSLLSKSHPLFQGFAILLFVMVTACGNDSNSSETSVSIENLPPYNIDLVTAYDKREAVALSDFAKSIAYVPLATPAEALIGRNAKFYLTGEYVIATAFRQLLIFNQQTGEFVKELRKYGEGPGEFRNTYPYLHMNEEKGTVYIKNNRGSYLGVNASGDDIVSFKSTEKSELYFMGFAQLTEDLFAGFLPNYDCKRTEKIVIFNTQGEVINTFENHAQCIDENSNGISFNFTEGSFYRWSQQVMFKERFNDTLFQVTRDSLVTKAVFQSAEYSLPYKDKPQLENDGSIADFYAVSQLDESNNQLFFSLSFKENTYNGYYDKKLNETIISATEDSDGNGFINDLDDFLPFKPLYATEDNRLVGYAEAPDILLWFEENPEKAKALPADLQALANMKEDDNPVVMIVELKD